jgi:tRNA U34 5-carboxymethylaminomethyl modifying GTPase MnmE/TrmE
MDLSQAEAVADVIASNSEASHTIAMQQMRGGITNELKNLRGQLLDFAALIELELDFSGEDVEFADRTKFKELVAKINTEQNPKLSAHFKIKSIPTLIVINQGNMVERFQGIVPIKNLEHLLDLYISENKKI